MVSLSREESLASFTKDALKPFFVCMQQQTITSPYGWLQLRDSLADKPSKGTRADKVLASIASEVADFRKAVQIKYDKPKATSSSLFRY